MSVITYRRKLDRLLAQYDQATTQVRQERHALKEAKERVETLLQAQQIVQTVAAAVQTSAHKQIASVVTRCLETVFGEEYGFRIDFERKRGKTEAKLIILKEGLVLDDPLNECGGGVMDLAALALRLVSIVLARPAKRRLLALDEPFRNVNGSEYRAAVNALLPLLAKELNLQLIIATGNDWLRVGKMVEL